MKFLKKLNDHFEAYFAALLLSIMTILIFFQVLSRFVFNAPLAWSEELARYVFIWTIYVSAALAVKEKEHIRVEIGLMIFKGKARKIANLVGNLIFIVFSTILLKEGVFLVQMLSKHVQVSPALGLPMNLLYIIIPLGYGLMLIRLLQQMFLEIRDLFKATSNQKNMKIK